MIGFKTAGMNSIKSQTFPLSQRSTVEPFVQAWDIAGAELQALNSMFTRWEAAVSPRIFKLPKRMGYDLAMVVAFEDEWENKRPKYCREITDLGRLHGTLRVLVRQQPSGKIYTFTTPNLPLEGKESDASICAWIQKELNHGTIREWAGTFPSNSLFSSFSRLIFNPFILKGMNKHLNTQGNNNFIAPVKLQIIPEIHWRTEIIDTPTVTARLRLKVNIGSRDCFVVNKEFFDGIKTRKIAPLERLGDNVVGLNMENIAKCFENLLTYNVNQARLICIQAAFKTFENYLDQDCLKTSKKILTVSERGIFYNWLQHEDFIKVLHRKQALETFPLLIEEPLSKEISSNKKGPETLSFSIDQGDSPVKFLSKWWVLSEGAVKITGGISLKDFESHVNVKTGLKTLKDIGGLIPRNWWPDASGKVDIAIQWNNFLSVINEVCRWNKKTYADRDFSNLALGTDIQRSLACTQAVWKTHTKAYPYFLDIQDMADRFAQQILLPLLVDRYTNIGNPIPKWTDLINQIGKAPDGGMSLIETSLMQHRTFNGLIECTDTWHKNYRRIEAEIVRAVDHRCWPGLIEVQKIQELWAVPLCSAGELAEESARMNHCVGTYVMQCLNDRCHIISLRDEEGNSVSTIEINLNHNEKQLRVVQNQAKANTTPSEIALRETDILMERLKNHLIEWDMIEDAFQSRQNSKESERSDIDIIVGYQSNLQEGRDAALRAWSFCLPRKYRDLTHAEWSEQAGLNQILEKLIPEPAGNLAP